MFIDQTQHLKEKKKIIIIIIIITCGKENGDLYQWSFQGYFR